MQGKYAHQRAMSRKMPFLKESPIFQTKQSASCSSNLGEEGEKMVEAKEALQRIKQAEEHAYGLVEDAQQKAVVMLQEAETLAEEKYNKILVSGKQEAERVKEKATIEGESEASQIIENGMQEAQSIRNIEEVKLKKAVKLIVERIVHNHGNR